MKQGSCRLLLLFFFILFSTYGLVFLIVGRPREATPMRCRRFCEARIRQIWSALQEYRSRTGDFPDILRRIENRTETRCPYSKENYVYVKPGKIFPAPVLWDKNTSPEHKRSVLFSDGNLYCEKKRPEPGK